MYLSPQIYFDLSSLKQSNPCSQFTPRSPLYSHVRHPFTINPSSSHKFPHNLNSSPHDNPLSSPKFRNCCIHCAEELLFLAHCIPIKLRFVSSALLPIFSTLFCICSQINIVLFHFWCLRRIVPNEVAQMWEKKQRRYLGLLNTSSFRIFNLPSLFFDLISNITIFLSHIPLLQNTNY